jgi:hypothetical protein
LPTGFQVDLPFEELHNSKQASQIVDEQLVVISGATKLKAKGGIKRNKARNYKTTLKPLEESFVPPSPTPSKWAFNHP